MTLTPKRRSPTQAEKWASCILMLKRGTGEYVITRKEAQGMTPAEIIREFDRRVVYAHGRAHALSGSMHPTNLWPTAREDDALETPKDISNIAKAKRCAKTWQAHAVTMAAKAGQALPLPARPGLVKIDVRGDLADSPAPRKPYKRKWSKGRPIPSRPFQKRRRAWI